MGALQIAKQYTSFGDKIDELQYNIVSILSEQDSIIKLLTFPESNCLEQTLTDEQRALAFDPTSNQCRVFLSPFVPQTEEVTCAQLRIYVPKIKPDTLYTAELTVYLDIMVDLSINRLDRGQRWFKLMSDLIGVLNGQELGTIGRLEFLKEPLTLICFKDNIWGYTLPFRTKVGAI